MGKILTAVQKPNHHTIGQFFAGWGGIYYCDSHEENHGYWMTRLDCPDDYVQPPDSYTDFRRNVSERAIGRTYHQIWIEPDGFMTTSSKSITGEEKQRITAFRTKLKIIEQNEISHSRD